MKIIDSAMGIDGGRVVGKRSGRGEEWWGWSGGGVVGAESGGEGRSGGGN